MISEIYSYFLGNPGDLDKRVKSMELDMFYGDKVPRRADHC
ncbi:MAG: hypothetical protein R2874_07375 [Desulfobacterales bacterium]